ncbi:MAG: hypothetical protein ACHQ5A_01215 [Opitutales bacterium]
MKYGASALLCMLLVGGCSKSPDSASPEGAVLIYEKACQENDMDAVIAAKDFVTEARLMSEDMHKHLNHVQIDADFITNTARQNERSFRDYWYRKGFPKLNGDFAFPMREAVEDGLVVVTEVFTSRSGEVVTQKILVSKTAQGWRVVHPIRENEQNQPPQPTPPKGG